MKKNICNICGGNLINKNGRWICEACGAYAPEEITSEEITLLYIAGQSLRNGDFDDAEEKYSDVVRQYPNNVDAYWGLVLAQYGIKYEKDYDGKMIPTCFSTSYESLYSNANYLKAVELADKEQKKYFKLQADKIEFVRKKWIDIASKEKPYDIFLSYKATENGQKTEDSVEAHEIYNELCKLGYRVFFSKETLSNKTGDDYEPYIFNALNTCHVMIVYASKPEYVISTWVRNEWLRFYKKIKNKEKLDNSLILIYKGFNPSVLSRPLSNTQNLDRNDIRFADKLESYLNRVVSEAKKIIPHIDSINIKQIDVDNKKIESINKRKLNGVRTSFSSNIESVNVREIGTYSSPKLTSKAEDRLNLGFIYLKKERYVDADNCFNEIIVNNKTNGVALLGKLLALEKCKELNDFLNKDLQEFNNFDLLKQTIDYLDKESSEKILDSLQKKVFEYIKLGNLKAVKNIYSQICDYNISNIQNSHAKLIDCIIKENIFSKEAIDIFNISLKFLLPKERDYLNSLTNIIYWLMKNNEYDKASKYYNEAKKYFNDISLVKCNLCLEAETTNIDDALLYLIRESNSEKIENIINGLSSKIADSFLCLLSDFILNNFSDISVTKRNEISSLIIQYDFSKSKEFDKNLLNQIVLKPNKENDDIFKLLTTTFTNKEIDSLINFICTYAINYADKNDFRSAEYFIDMAINYDQTNQKLLKLKIAYSIDIKQYNELWKNIYKLSSFTAVEKLLMLNNTDEDLVNKLVELCDQCIEYINFYKNNINKSVFDVFDRLIRYFPESSNLDLVSLIQRIADSCKENELFDSAEKYYSMMTGIDSTEFRAYWGLLQSKLKCKNNNDLIHQYKPISSMPEFNNAIIAAGSNSSVVEEYIDCRTKQELWINRQEKNKVRRKKVGIFITIAISLLVVFSTLFSLTKNVFIPNSKYETALNLLNSGNYQEAYNQLMLMNYKDSSSQILVAKAGLAFETGDYESGIQNIYDAGGTVNVSYDGNGGSVPKSGETIKRLRSFINNDPSLYGYEFYGWKIDSFTIVSSYENYSCDLKLIASWEIVNYSISYNLNGGHASNLPQSYNCESNDIVLEYPTKTGYTFIGWTGTGIDTLQKTVTIKKGSIGNRVYEANYEANEYTITYDYGYDGKTSTDTATYDSQYNLEEPERLGYEFTGWENNGSPVSSGIWKNTENVTLTATWRAVEYSITYNLDGGVNSASNLTQYSIETPTFSLTNPTKDGYDFIGWTGTNIASNTLDVTINNGSTGNREYFAHWKEHTYKVTLDARGGSCSSSELSVDYNSSLILPEPTKNGYSFVGWYNSIDNTLITNCTWKYLSDLSLYAKWSLDSHTITYVLNGGINNSGNPSEFTFESNDIVILNPSRPGYTFTGWNSILGNNQIEPTISNGSYIDLTFEATWTANLNTIIFDGNSNTSGSMDSIQGYTDSTIKLSQNKFVKDGYHFIGWSLTNNGLTNFVDEDDYKVTTDAITTLYAIWEANVNSITYYGNGSDSGNMDNQYLSTDESGILNNNEYSKKGYHFKGWSSSSNGEVEYSDKDNYLMGANNNYDLYAIWEPNEYTISYNTNGGSAISTDKIVTYDLDYCLETSSRTGYYFTGWFLGNTQLTDSDGNSLKPFDIAGNITVTAHWSPKVNAVILTDGDKQVILEGYSDSVIRLSTDAFTRDGFILLGWSENNGGSLKYYNDDLYYVGTNSSYRLYAVWEEEQHIDFSGYTKISNKDEFLDIINNESSGKYCLTNDIDLEGSTILPTQSFYGKLNGNNYTVRNFVLSLSEAEFVSSEYPREVENYSYKYYAGFFKKNNGTIENINIEDYSFDINYSSIKIPKVDHQTSWYYLTCSYLYVGTICGENNNIINKCRIITPNQNFTLSIGAAYYIGGVCGIDNTSSDLKNCFIVNNISYSGTIVSGHYEYYGSYNCLYTDNFFYFGGIVGNKKSGQISDCLVLNNGSVNVITKEYYKYDTRNTNYTYSGTFSGTDTTLVRCNNVNDLSNYSNFICFNYNGRKIYQFVNGSSRVKLNKNIFIKHGYQFVGWSLSEGGNVEYGDMDICWIDYGSKELELYPVFVPITYEIQFESNGGNGIMNNQQADCDATVIINSNQFFKTGYHFGGWSTTNGGDIVYYENDELKMGPQDIVLYAVWLPNENHIVFHANGGNGYMQDQIILSDSSVILNECQFEAPNGYYFVGWSSDPNGTVEYHDHSTFTSGTTSIINLYAIWSKI